MGNRPSSPRSGAPAAEDGSKSPHTQPESSDHRRRHSFDLEFVPGPSPPKSRRSSRRSLEAAATVEAKEGIEHYRQKGISERTVRLSPPPSYGSSCREEDVPRLAAALSNLSFFTRLSEDFLRQMALSMLERQVPSGEQLIRQGETGEATDEMYVVRSGQFEVYQKRHESMMLVNKKDVGAVFGELGLLYTTPRSATVQAITDSTVWVLTRSTFKTLMQKQHVVFSEREVFLNSVPILAPLGKEQRLTVAELLEEVEFAPGDTVIREGDIGNRFYIIMEGECSVRVEHTTGDKQQVHGGSSPDVEVNKLFRADFFGERALLTDEPRGATVVVVGDTPLRCLTLTREVFTEYLGPLQELLEKEKNAVTTQQRMSDLSLVHVQKVKVVLKSVDQRLGKVQTACSGTASEMLLLGKPIEASTMGRADDSRVTVTLEVGRILGGGCNGLVRLATDVQTGRQYALKILNKVQMVTAAEHVFQEQKYATFQTDEYLYFLFDHLSGGDLMDRLASEAKIVTARKGMMGKSKKYLKGIKEEDATFFVASLVLALNHLHRRGIIFRDMKPENVMLDGGGYVKLVDFGFSKALPFGDRTFTFCGTPGYVAPETILARGYNHTADFWCLGVTMYVLLTGRQPFSSPNAMDPMKVMKRILDVTVEVQYPPYLSDEAVDCMSRLLDRRPAHRLGSGANGIEDIMRHPWFARVDWTKLEARRVKPPRSDGDIAIVTELQNQRMKDLEAEHAVLPATNVEELVEAQSVFASF